MSFRWLCERRRAALAIYTLLLAYILTMWFSPSSAFDCHRPHGLAGCCRAFYLPYLRRSSFRPCCASPSFLWCRCWVTRGMEVYQRPMSVLRCWRDSNPRLPTACVRFPTPSPQSSGGSCLPESASCVGPLRRPRGVIVPASARWIAGCMRSASWRRWVCGGACALTRSRAG